MKIYLDLYKADIIDRKQFMDKYNLEKTDVNGVPFRVIQPYKMLCGAPNLVSVEGSLIDSSTIMDMIVNRNQRTLSAVNRWLADLKSPSNVCSSGEILDFKWRR